MSHIERMQDEARQLSEKIEAATDFLTKEMDNPKLTDEMQRLGLGIQINYMNNYLETLNDRISYDNFKEGGKK